MKKFFYFYAVPLLFLFSCENGGELLLAEEQEEAPVTHHGIMMSGDTEQESVLGNFVENPYSVEVMRRANQNVYGPHSSITIETTHLYIQFVPADSVQYDRLKDIREFEYYPYPMDMEILTEGIVYDIPPTSIGDFPNLWAVIEVGQQHLLPADIQHIVLEECFIPDEDNPTRSGEGLTAELIARLEDEAMRLTGHGDEIPNPRLRIPSKWQPRGRIRVYDDKLKDTLPLEGVKIRARHLLKVKREVTDANGYYSMGSFRYGVYYQLEWERADWEIRDGFYVQANYNGPNNVREGWSLDITGTGKSIRYAHIHRAAHRWFYKDVLGLTRPKMGHGGKIRIGYKDKNKDFGGIFEGISTPTMGFFSDIRIFRSANGVDQMLHEIFSTTIHELAHAAHYTHAKPVGFVSYWVTDEIVYESWAEFVEKILTIHDYAEWSKTGKDIFTKTYPYRESYWYYFPDKPADPGDNSGVPGDIYTNHNRTHHGPIPYTGTRELRYKDPVDIEESNDLNKQSWPVSGLRSYSPLFIDIHDNSNQRSLQHILGIGDQPYATGYVNDNVCLNDVPVLESIAFNARSTNGVKNQLEERIRMFDYPFTTQDIDNLFEFY